MYKINHRNENQRTGDAVGNVHLRQGNRQNNTEAVCAFGLRKDNTLQKRKLYYQKCIMLRKSNRAAFGYTTHLNDYVP